MEVPFRLGKRVVASLPAQQSIIFSFFQLCLLHAVVAPSNRLLSLFSYMEVSRHLVARRLILSGSAQVLALTLPVYFLSHTHTLSHWFFRHGHFWPHSLLDKTWWTFLPLLKCSIVFNSILCCIWWKWHFNFKLWHFWNKMTHFCLKANCSSRKLD